MILSFQQDNPLQSLVMDGRNVRRYETTSAVHQKLCTTRVVAIGEHTEGRILGDILWTKDGPRITISGTCVVFDEFLRKSDGFWPSLSRTFLAADGRKYKWKLDGRSDKLGLVDVQRQAHIAHTHHAKSGGLFSSSRKMNIVIEQGNAIADDIVFTFVIMEQLRRIHAQQRARHMSTSNDFTAMTNMNTMNMINNMNVINNMNTVAMSTPSGPPPGGGC